MLCNKHNPSVSQDFSTALPPEHNLQQQPRVQKRNRGVGLADAAQERLERHLDEGGSVVLWRNFAVVDCAFWSHVSI